MRDILSEKKSHLKRNEISMMQMPLYTELSVKALYPDAMKDPAVAKYLPTLDQLSGKMPERDFFFGILFTAKMQFMRYVIAEANERRFKASKDDTKQSGIAISDSWL